MSWHRSVCGCTEFAMLGLSESAGVYGQASQVHEAGNLEALQRDLVLKGFSDVLVFEL